MDKQRLTPELRRQVLRLPAGDRVALMGAIRESLLPSDRLGRLEALGEVMNALTGLEIRHASRRADYVRARTVFAFAARQEAFTQSEVAGWLGLDHSTVHYLERRMAEALDYPTGFADYIELYNTYTSRII